MPVVGRLSAVHSGGRLRLPQELIGQERTTQAGKALWCRLFARLCGRAGRHTPVKQRPLLFADRGDLRRSFDRLTVRDTGTPQPLCRPVGLRSISQPRFARPRGRPGRERVRYSGPLSCCLGDCHTAEHLVCGGAPSWRLPTITSEAPRAPRRPHPASGAPRAATSPEGLTGRSGCLSKPSEPQRRRTPAGRPHASSRGCPPVAAQRLHRSSRIKGSLRRYAPLTRSNAAEPRRLREGTRGRVGGPARGTTGDAPPWPTFARETSSRIRKSQPRGPRKPM